MTLGRLEGVVWREVDGEGKDAALVGTVRGTHDGGGPVVDVAGVCGTSGAVGRRVATHFVQFLLNPLKRHISIVYSTEDGDVSSPCTPYSS